MLSPAPKAMLSQALFRIVMHHSDTTHEHHDVSNHWRICYRSYSLFRLMMTSSNGNIFRVTGHVCGEFTGPGEFPSQRPVTRTFDVYFDLRLNKRLSKQSWGWWFETLSSPLWRHSNVTAMKLSKQCIDGPLWGEIYRWLLDFSLQRTNNVDCFCILWCHRGIICASLQKELTFEYSWIRCPQ